MENKGKLMRDISVIIAVVLLAAIFSISYVEYNRSILMSTNIQNAIDKGIDPLAVRCSYSAKEDVVCALYAGTQRTSVDAPKVELKTTKR
jgi:hypothetical protein